MSDQISPVSSDSAANSAELTPGRKPLSRRTMLKIGGAIATAAVASPILAACGDSPTATTGAATSTTAAAAGATTAASSGTATTAAAGAATSAASSSGGGTLLVYWGTGHNYNSYAAVRTQFEKDFPGWKIQWELYQQADMHTKLLANYAAGNVPDLVEEPGGWIPEFGLQDKILPLNSYVDKDGKTMGFPSDWQPFTINRATINNNIYGIQLHLTNILLFYNKDMLSKAGFQNPPANWDEFVTAAKATTQGSTFGFALNQDSSYAWPWFLQNGAHWYDADKKVLVMDTPEAIEAMQFQADLIYKHKVAPIPVAAVSYEGPQKLFSAKRAAMILTGPWDLKAIKDGSPDVNLGIGQALTHKTQATSAAGTSMFIPKGAKNADMAWEFMKRVTALDVELATTKEANMTMPRVSWSQNPEVQANPTIAGFAKGLSYAKDASAELGLTGKLTQIQPLYNKMYQDVIYKNTPAADALKEFVTNGNKILAGQ